MAGWDSFESNGQKGRWDIPYVRAAAVVLSIGGDENVGTAIAQTALGDRGNHDIGCVLRWAAGGEGTLATKL